MRDGAEYFDCSKKDSGSRNTFLNGERRRGPVAAGSPQRSVTMRAVWRSETAIWSPRYLPGSGHSGRSQNSAQNTVAPQVPASRCSRGWRASEPHLSLAWQGGHPSSPVVTKPPEARGHNLNLCQSHTYYCPKKTHHQKTPQKLGFSLLSLPFPFILIISRPLGGQPANCLIPSCKLTLPAYLGLAGKPGMQIGSPRLYLG